MAQPWRTIEAVGTADGLLELRQRGARDFLICINNRVLMNSSAHRSEQSLGRDACAAIAERPHPRVLIGGLGMGITLRSALDALPQTARIHVAEINPVIAQWCRGPLAALTNSALHDPRITVLFDDVAAVIGRAAKRGAERYEAIVIDLYVGPSKDTDELQDPFYGEKALQTTADALSSGGIFAVWGENPDAAFERRLAAAGFSVDRKRPGKGGLRHVVYLARKLS